MVVAALDAVAEVDLEETGFAEEFKDLHGEVSAVHPPLFAALGFGGVVSGRCQIGMQGFGQLGLKRLRGGRRPGTGERGLRGPSQTIFELSQLSCDGRWNSRIVVSNGLRVQLMPDGSDSAGSRGELMR